VFPNCDNRAWAFPVKLDYPKLCGDLVIVEKADARRGVHDHLEHIVRVDPLSIRSEEDASHSDIALHGLWEQWAQLRRERHFLFTACVVPGTILSSPCTRL